MSCGEVLILGEAGQVQCTNPGCPRPLAVCELLADPEAEHVVILTRTGFTIRHPLRERLDDELMRCPLHAYLAGGGWRPGSPGLYRAREQGSPPVVTWEELP